MSPREVEQHFTTRELADLLNVHPETIRRTARSGELRSIRVGLDRRYSESAVREWLEGLASPSPGKPAV